MEVGRKGFNLLLVWLEEWLFLTIGMVSQCDYTG